MSRMTPPATSWTTVPQKYHPHTPPPAPGAAVLPTASLYVGQLDPTVTEAMLFEIFNMIGPVGSIHVCRDVVTRRSLGYAYVNYLNVADGERALEQLNNAIIKNRPCRIMWSQRDPALRKRGQGSIFVKNLDEAIDNKALHDIFAAFGNILSCKVATDETGKSRGHGYVDYETAESAEAAIKAVNRTLINNKPVYVSPHLSRKERQTQFDGMKSQFTNIYVKNLDTELTEVEFKAMFGVFDTITSAVLQTDQEGKSRGFGFVNFESHEGAERAVNEMNGRYVNGKALYVGPAQMKSERQTLVGRQIPRKADVRDRFGRNMGSDNQALFPVDEQPTNNQGAPPDDISPIIVASEYPKDTKYYQPYGSGVFLVDGLLFKVQATAIFGSRLEATVEPNMKFTSVYLEDILPRLPGSSDTSPIELRGITTKQFQTYLLMITGLPCDEEYLSLLVNYLTPEKRNRELFLQYLDVATVAPRFGMTKLARWAMNALETILRESTDSLCQIPRDWTFSTLLQLRQLTRGTNLDAHIRTFVQYLIYKLTRDLRHIQDISERSPEIIDLIDIYQGFKTSNGDDALFGCVFFNILSLGHRSPVWSHLSRDEKAVLYATQVQLADKFIPQSLELVTKPVPELEQTLTLCTGCQRDLSTIWEKTFGKCGQALGSATTLKGILSIAEMPGYYWMLLNKMGAGSCRGAPSAQATFGKTGRATCSIRPLLKYIDQRVQDVYELAASRYRTISEEF